jgi:hypothetical protein
MTGRKSSGSPRLVSSAGPVPLLKKPPIEPGILESFDGSVDDLPARHVDFYNQPAGEVGWQCGEGGGQIKSSMAA